MNHKEILLLKELYDILLEDNDKSIIRNMLDLRLNSIQSEFDIDFDLTKKELGRGQAIIRIIFNSIMKKYIEDGLIEFNEEDSYFPGYYDIKYKDNSFWILKNDNYVKLLFLLSTFYCKPINELTSTTKESLKIYIESELNKLIIKYYKL